MAPPRRSETIKYLNWGKGKKQVASKYKQLDVPETQVRAKKVSAKNLQPSVTFS